MGKSIVSCFLLTHGVVPYLAAIATKKYCFKEETVLNTMLLEFRILYQNVRNLIDCFMTLRQTYTQPGRASLHRIGRATRVDRRKCGQRPMLTTVSDDWRVLAKFYEYRVWDKVPQGTRLPLRLEIVEFPYNTVRDRWYASRLKTRRGRMHDAVVSVSPGLKLTYDGLATTPLCMTPT